MYEAFLKLNSHVIENTFFITKTNRLMLFSGKISELSENDKHTNKYSVVERKVFL
jgi:hypothetical protein